MPQSLTQARRRGALRMGGTARGRRPRPAWEWGVERQIATYTAAQMAAEARPIRAQGLSTP